MRRRAIDDPDKESMRIPVKVSHDATELAKRLDAAAKPSGFPMTNVSKSNSQPRLRKVKGGHAMSLAVALVLDLLDDGTITHLDLLRRSALLKEVNPAKAQALIDLKSEKKLLGLTNPKPPQ